MQSLTLLLALVLFAFPPPPLQHPAGANDSTTASFALSEARAGLTGITLPQAAWFAGGVQGDFTFLNTIDVVTVDANGAIQTEHTAHSLSIARAFAAGAYSQGKVIIAGGMTQFNIDSENKNATATFTDRVDIFDVATGKRTTSKLSSSAGGYITAVATKDFVFFAAGLKKAAYTLNVDIIYQDTSNAVDVYHVKSGEWRKLTLAGGARMWATGMAVSTTTNAVVIPPGSIYEGAERSYTDQLDVLSATAVESSASSAWPFALLSFVASFFA